MASPKAGGGLFFGAKKKPKPAIDVREIADVNTSLDLEDALSIGLIKIQFISPLPAKVRLSFIDYTNFYPSSRPVPCPGTWFPCEYLTLLLRAAQTSNLEPCVDELVPTIVCNHVLCGSSIWTTLSPGGSTLHENADDLRDVIEDLMKVEETYTNPILVIPTQGTETIPDDWK
ncbi:hypothetical protein TrRE_jg3850, partial [Triparma retinervis]